jgi:hypothetical protein
VEAATRYLAQELNVPPEAVEPSVIEPVDWPDATLGCPEPGKAYAQVVTPGYRMVLEVDGKDYELHTDRTGGVVRICERDPQEGPAAAVEYLAAEIGVAAKEIEVLSVDAYEWPDASLGCPEPGRSYAQVVTPGYRVVLRAKRSEYQVRTDVEGQITVLCEPGQ